MNKAKREVGITSLSYAAIILLLDGLAWTPSPKEKTLYGLYVIKKTKAAVSLQTQNT